MVVGRCIRDLPYLLETKDWTGPPVLGLSPPRFKQSCRTYSLGSTRGEDRKTAIKKKLFLNLLFQTADVAICLSPRTEQC